MIEGSGHLGDDTKIAAHSQRKTNGKSDVIYGTTHDLGRPLTLFQPPKISGPVSRNVEQQASK